MATFFRHENQLYPPSLSDHGKLRFAKKSGLVQILELESQQDQPCVFDVMVIDGAALVHMLPVKDATTFDEYASSVFTPYYAAIGEMYQIGCSLGQVHQQQPKSSEKRKERQRRQEESCWQYQDS